MPSTYTGTLFQYELSHKIHEKLSSGADKRYVKDYNAVRDFDNQVSTLLDNVPAAIRPENPDTSWDVKQPVLIRERERIACTAHAFLLFAAPASLCHAY